MADYTITNLTTAVVGFSSTIMLKAGSSTLSAVFETSNGTIGQNMTFSDSSLFSLTQPGWLTGRRPSQGQLFPRGVYNK